MHFVYIIKSINNSKFYIGETYDIEQRLNYHNSIELNNNSTRTGIPWRIYHIIECKNRTVARKIETHIKEMKSRKYIENLIKYPEISQRLVNKYSK